MLNVDVMLTLQLPGAAGYYTVGCMGVGPLPQAVQGGGSLYRVLPRLAHACQCFAFWCQNSRVLEVRNSIPKFLFTIRPADVPGFSWGDARHLRMQDVLNARINICLKRLVVRWFS